MAFWDFLKIKAPDLSVYRAKNPPPLEEGWTIAEKYVPPDMGPAPRPTREDEADFIIHKLRHGDDDAFGPMMPGCNRVTNSPCQWSRTDPIEDKCRMCGTQFPGWY